MSKPSGPASASCSADQLTHSRPIVVSGRGRNEAQTCVVPSGAAGVRGLGSRVVEGRGKGDVDAGDELFLDARRLATAQAALRQQRPRRNGWVTAG